MAQQRPTHEVFRQKVSNTSYQNFVPASSVKTKQLVSTETIDSPSVDPLDQFRRDDEAYLKGVVQAQRDQAVEQLETERLAGERFRRERVTVRGRVNVAKGVRGRYEQPLIGKLGLASLAKKKRAERKNAPSERDGGKGASGKLERVVNERNCDDAELPPEDLKNVPARVVPLVSGYSSSSDEEDDAACDGSAKAGGRTSGGEAGD